ncbi:hypothetical protein [Pseudanabaena sp. FACHB-2040]|uniref:hypothetical protein n=1 Tax=Pseudanabaena sp. FACHB-2040 TaxID=2692859 RepID=UPI001685D27D|nr:hypothetical protein [Pseudanabaena sp. FACHB-2040]MBD2259434.1 hypothetical protein [Pseudanabaena sp. FACHB-2040]
MGSDWRDISPRNGLGGLLDRFIGPGATKAELLLQFVPPLIAMIVAPAYALTLPIQWTPVQIGLIALLALDLVGGVLTNATSAAKRWYHRPGQGWQQHLAFVSLHVIHVWLVAVLFRGGDWVFGLSTSGYLLGAAILILRSPLYLQRPVALGLYGLALLGDRYLFTPTPGLEWFLPFFFLKLLVSHLLQD